MQYNYYKSFMEISRRSLIKNGLKVPVTAIPGMFIEALKNPGPIPLGGKEFDMCVDEANYFSSERNVIFPESMDVIDNLLNATHSLKVFPQPADQCFIVNFPKDYRYHNVEIPPALVSIYDRKNHQHRFDNLAKYADLQLPVIREIERQNDWSIHILFQKTAGAFVHCCFVNSQFLDVLNVEPEDIHSVVETHWTGQFISSEERVVEHTVFKFVLSMLVYTQSNPGALVPGMPTQKRRMMKSLGRTRPLQLTTAQEIREQTERATHYRSWHFRQLMDERYYQNEHANKPRGSRIIFVRDAIVGRDNPSTLTT